MASSPGTGWRRARPGEKVRGEPHHESPSLRFRPQARARDPPRRVFQPRFRRPRWRGAGRVVEPPAAGRHAARLQARQRRRRAELVDCVSQRAARFGGGSRRPGRTPDSGAAGHLPGGEPLSVPHGRGRSLQHPRRRLRRSARVGRDRMVRDRRRRPGEGFQELGLVEFHPGVGPALARREQSGDVFQHRLGPLEAEPDLRHRRRRRTVLGPHQSQWGGLHGGGRGLRRNRSGLRRGGRLSDRASGRTLRLSPFLLPGSGLGGRHRRGAPGRAGEDPPRPAAHRLRGVHARTSRQRRGAVLRRRLHPGALHPLPADRPQLHPAGNGREIHRHPLHRGAQARRPSPPRARGLHSGRVHALHSGGRGPGAHPTPFVDATAPTCSSSRRSLPGSSGSVPGRSTCSPPWRPPAPAGDHPEPGSRSLSPSAPR